MGRIHKIVPVDHNKRLSKLGPSLSALRPALANPYLRFVHACAPEPVLLFRSNTVFHVRPPNALSAWLGQCSRQLIWIERDFFTNCDRRSPVIDSQYAEALGQCAHTMQPGPRWLVQAGRTLLLLCFGSMNLTNEIFPKWMTRASGHCPVCSDYHQAMWRWCRRKPLFGYSSLDPTLVPA